MLLGALTFSCHIIQGLSHDLGNHQWTRFLTHAARVKSLRLCVEPPATDQEAPPDSADEDLDAGDQDSNYFDNIDEDLRTILFLRSRYEAPIFRNLRVLEVALAWQWNEAYSTYSPAFFGPKITTVRIEGSIRKLLLNQLVLGCPQLRCLEFESFMAGATGLLWCFNALEELRSHEQYFDDKLDLATVAYLPALRHLWITLTTLDTLQLSSVSHANDLPTLLEKVSSIRLRDLSINLDYDCLRDGNVVEAMDKTLCTLTKFPLLRRLRIRGSGSATSMFSPLPLLKLGSLEELSLETGGFFSTNQTIIDLGKACPRLRHLQIFSNDAGGGVPPSWKLDALELFATHLPKIHYIETEYDTSSVAPATRTPLAQSLLPTTLVVRSSVLRKEDWERAAAYIAEVYPNATCRLDCYYDRMDDDKLPLNQLHWRYVSRAMANTRDGSSLCNP